MKVRVLLFAQLAETLGRREWALDLPAEARVHEALAALEAEFPDLHRARPSLAVAVNERYARPDQPLREGDVLALIPPVSGG